MQKTTLLLILFVTITLLQACFSHKKTLTVSITENEPAKDAYVRIGNSLFPTNAEGKVKIPISKIKKEIGKDENVNITVTYLPLGLEKKISYPRKNFLSKKEKESVIVLTSGGNASTKKKKEALLDSIEIKELGIAKEHLDKAAKIIEQLKEKQKQSWYKDNPNSAILDLETAEGVLAALKKDFEDIKSRVAQLRGKLKNKQPVPLIEIDELYEGSKVVKEKAVDFYVKSDNANEITDINGIYAMKDIGDVFFGLGIYHITTDQNVLNNFLQDARQKVSNMRNSNILKAYQPNQLRIVIYTEGYVDGVPILPDLAYDIQSKCINKYDNNVCLSELRAKTVCDYFASQFASGGYEIIKDYKGKGLHTTAQGIYPVQSARICKISIVLKPKNL